MSLSQSVKPASWNLFCVFICFGLQIQMKSTVYQDLLSVNTQVNHSLLLKTDGIAV